MRAQTPDSDARRRVFLLNNYDLRDAFDRVAAGELPSQHLWGAWELRNDVDWVVPPRNWVSGRNWITSVLRRLMPIVGDLAQETHVLAHARRGDIAYAADQQSSALLGALRRMRLLRCELVVVVHNGPRSRWTRWWMGGADALLSLGEAIAERNTRALTRSALPMPWGPGLSSPVYQRVVSAPEPSWDFVAAGNTNRDYGILEEAAAQRGLSGCIVEAGTARIIDRGAVVDTHAIDGYPDLVRMIRASRWVVIPLADPDRLSGLTEAADALALETPMIVTHSALFPYAAEGIVRVELGRADALGDALVAMRPKMTGLGEVALGTNMDVYASRLAEVFDSVGISDGRAPAPR